MASCLNICNEKFILFLVLFCPDNSTSLATTFKITQALLFKIGIGFNTSLQKRFKFWLFQNVCILVNLFACWFVCLFAELSICLIVSLLCLNVFVSLCLYIYISLQTANRQKMWGIYVYVCVLLGNLWRTPKKYLLGSWLQQTFIY